MKKRKETADEEAKLALQQYEESLNELKDKNVVETQEKNVLSGRRVFGASKKQVQQSSDKMKSDNYYGDNDSDGVDADEANDEEFDKNKTSQVDVSFDPNVLREESEIDHYSIFKVIEFLIAG